MEITCNTKGCNASAALIDDGLLLRYNDCNDELVAVNNGDTVTVWEAVRAALRRR